MFECVTFGHQQAQWTFGSSREMEHNQRTGKSWGIWWSGPLALCLSFSHTRSSLAPLHSSLHPCVFCQLPKESESSQSFLTPGFCFSWHSEEEEPSPSSCMRPVQQAEKLSPITGAALQGPCVWMQNSKSLLDTPSNWTWRSRESRFIRIEEIFFLMFIQFLKVTFYLQLLQNIGYVPILCNTSLSRSYTQ